jgi:hypothetical protein
MAQVNHREVIVTRHTQKTVDLRFGITHVATLGSNSGEANTSPRHRIPQPASNLTHISSAYI